MHTGEVSLYAYDSILMMPPSYSCRPRNEMKSQLLAMTTGWKGLLKLSWAIVCAIQGCKVSCIALNIFVSLCGWWYMHGRQASHCPSHIQYINDELCITFQHGTLFTIVLALSTNMLDSYFLIRSLRTVDGYLVHRPSAATLYPLV